MKEMWAYDKQRRFDHSGKRWHFVRRDIYATNIPYEDRPVELYFRDDERKEFGLLRFERQKEIPFRDYEVMINKVMNDREFRATLIASETSTVWNRNWK